MMMSALGLAVVIGVACTSSSDLSPTTTPQETPQPTSSAERSPGPTATVSAAPTIPSLTQTNPDSWTRVAPLSVPRALHHAVALADGRVLMFGGVGDSGPLNASEIYDPDANTWTRTGDTVWPRRRTISCKFCVKSLFIA